MKIEQIWQDLITEKVIGQGSYGTVYKCYRENNGEKEYSAVKVISIPQTGEEYYGYNTEGMTIEQTKEYYRDIVDDFTNEIKILESLKGNKNIVEIKNYEVIEKTEEIGWEIFIEMELLTDFNSYACDKTFTEDEVLKLGIDLCNALYVCNEKNIIHRDIKPENIFVSDTGDFKLGDFGVSRQLEKTDASMSRKGTFNYMAPEVFYSKKYDSRADVYSLGLVMYKLLNNNRMPFLDAEKQIIKYSERQEAFDKRINGEKIPEIKGISDELNEVILKACEYKAEDRYNSAEEFRKTLEKRKLTGVSGWVYRHKKALWAAVAFSVVLSLSVSIALALKLGNNVVDAQDAYLDENVEILSYDYMETGAQYTANPIDGKFVYAGNKGVFVYDDHSGKTTQLFDKESMSPAFNGDEVCFVSDDKKAVYKTTLESEEPEKIFTADDFEINEIVYFNNDRIVVTQVKEDLCELLLIDIANENYEKIATLGDDNYSVYVDGMIIYLADARKNSSACEMYSYNISSGESVLLASDVYADDDFAKLFEGQLRYLSKAEDGSVTVKSSSLDESSTGDITKAIEECKDVVYWDMSRVVFADTNGKSNMYNIPEETVTELKDTVKNVYVSGEKLYAFKAFDKAYRLSEINTDGSFTAAKYTDDIKNKFDVISIKEGLFLSWNADESKIDTVNLINIDPMLIEADKRAWTLFENETMGDFAVYVNESNYDCQNVDFKSFLYNYFLEKDGQSAIYYGYFGEAETFSYKDVPDPKQRFNFENPYGWDPADVGGYRRYQIENIKWVCENIFNVDFEMISDFSTKENEYEFYAGEGQEPYFYDGYLYVPFYYGGDGGRDRKLESKSELADGRYLVTVGMYAIDSDKKIGEFEMTIGYKNISGSKHWSLYKLQVIATINDLEDLNVLKSEETGVYPNPEYDKVCLMFDETGEYVVGIEAKIYGDYDVFVDRYDIFARITVDDVVSNVNGVDVYNNEVYYFYTDKTFVQGCKVIDGVEEHYEEYYSDGYEVEFKDGYATIKLFLNKKYLAEDIYPDFGFDFEIREGTLYNSNNQATNYAVNVEDFYR